MQDGKCVVLVPGDGGYRGGVFSDPSGSSTCVLRQSLTGPNDTAVPTRNDTKNSLELLCVLGVSLHTKYVVMLREICTKGTEPVRDALTCLAPLRPYLHSQVPPNPLRPPTRRHNCLQPSPSRPQASAEESTLVVVRLAPATNPAQTPLPSLRCRSCFLTRRVSSRTVAHSFHNTE